MSEQLLISAVILAAGASRRMGQSKMLLPWGDTFVIQKVVTTLLNSGVYKPIIVTGRSSEDIRKIVRSDQVLFAHNPNYETTEMLQSLQIGLHCLPGNAAAFLIVLGDQPQIDSLIIHQIVAEFKTKRPSIIIPSYKFRRGHPWLVSKEWLPELLTMSDTATLRDFLNTHKDAISYLNVDDSSVLMDLDTPDDYVRHKPQSTTENPDED